MILYLLTAIVITILIFIVIIILLHFRKYNQSRVGLNLFLGFWLVLSAVIVLWLGKVIVLDG